MDATLISDLQKRAAIISKYERIYPKIWYGLSQSVYEQARIGLLLLVTK